ncbi:uncharacterized protein LOC144860133 [Branchiostoma floridae x Branchiostoma japonicum]
MASAGEEKTPTDGRECPLEVDQLTISEKHLSQEELDELEMIRDEDGDNTDFDKIAHRMTLKLQDSEHATVNIGIVGEAGAGKSTFINSFRGIKPGEEGAAEVSAFRHTTNEVTRYPVPDNQNIVLMDFPGVIFRNTGTRLDMEEEFNTKSYLDLYGTEMEECDVFLVFVTCRVSNNIIWIAKEVRKMKKKVLFVRSKIDVDLANESRDNPRRFPEGTSSTTIEVRRFVEELRKVTTKELERLSYAEVKETMVFVICGLPDDVASGTYDMTNLRKAIYNTLSPDKKGVLINGLVEFATDMVHEKAEHLRSREVIAAAVANTVISATPIPGLGLALDIAILVAGYHRSKRALCLNDKSLRQLAAVGNKDYESLKKFVDRRLVLSEKIQNASGPVAIRAVVGVAAAGVTVGALAFTSMALRIALPLVGGIIAAPASAALVVYIMRKMINEMETCAIELHEYAFGEDPSPAYIGILGKECSSRKEFLNAIRGIRTSDPRSSIPQKSPKKPVEHESSENLVFVEFPGPDVKKSFFRDTVDEDAYRKSFGDDLKLCDVCLVFIDKDVNAETVAVAKIAKERTKVLFVRLNEFHPSANQSGTTIISALQKKLEKVKFGDMDMSDVFIISTEYDAVTQDIGETPALRRAIFKELQDADKTDRNVMYMSLDTLMLNDDDAGTMTKSLADGLRGIEMLGQNQSGDVLDLIKSKEDCLPKWEQATIRIGIISDHGAGTNTFISSFLGYREKVASRTAAGHGSTQTEYTSADPERPQNLTVVRFPAVSFAIGRPEDIKSRYMKCQVDNMKSCDVFIVLCGDVVTTETVWLAVQAQALDKKVLFVKSKFDLTAENTSEDATRPRSVPPRQQQVKQSLATAIQEKLSAEGSTMTVKMDDIFLISGTWKNVKQGEFDMVRLRQAMMEPLDELQKQAFIILCKDYSLRMIPTKSALLKQMVWTQAVQSGALRPWSGLLVDAPIDLEAVRESCEVYKRCFGLDEASLEDLAELAGINKECIRESVRRKLPICTVLFDTTDLPQQSSVRSLVDMMAKNGSTLMTLELANYSFETTVNCGSLKGKAMHVVAYFLRKIITEQAECACALYEELFATR